MRVDFVGHATLLVEHAGFSLLSDPWWSGPAYRGQWYPYPLPVPERYDLSRVDAVYISHAHEDHLHPATLRELVQKAPNAEIIIPRRYDSQMRDYLRRLGFTRIHEAPSGTPLRLGPMQLTVFTHMDDSLLAVEAGAEVLVNANDALHSSRRELIHEYCRILRGRFKQIDYLFCGFGGASYFPNCFRVPGKDDVAVARAREEFFLHNFALVAELLRPKLAFPFAAHFVLPNAHTWWISETRLHMDRPSATVRRLLPDSPTEFFDLEPGDYVDSAVVHRADVNDHGVQDAREVVLQRYGPGASRQPVAMDELIGDIRQAIAPKLPTRPLHAVLVLWDMPDQAIEIRAATDLDIRTIQPADIAAAEAEVVFETRSDLVASTIKSSFGRDLITIGYGAEVHLRSADDVASAPHERLLNLLAPTPPRWRERLRQAPVRTLGFVLGDPSMRLDLLGRLAARRRSRPSAEPGLYELSDWSKLARAPE